MRESRNLHELQDLAGRVALVTGGAGGRCGRQCVEALGEAGATVVVTSRKSAKAIAAAERFCADGLKAEGQALELRSPESIHGLVQEIVDRHGRIDILVNNAGHNVIAAVEDMTLADWNDVMAVNVTGTMLVSRAVAEEMKRLGSGVIVNVSSIYGTVAPDPDIYGSSRLNSPLVYGVSKAAVIQMTRYLAVYWAPLIRVNCVTLGGLFAGQDPEFVREYCRRTPLQRMGGPDDLKGAVAFLASDASSWATGMNLVVDGGWTIW